MRLAQSDATSDHGSSPSPATLKTPGRSWSKQNLIERMTSSSWTNWNRGSNPKIPGTRGSCSNRLSGVSICAPITLENRSIATFTCGLSSAKSRTYPSTASRLRSIGARAGLERGVSSVNQTGSSGAQP